MAENNNNKPQVRVSSYRMIIKIISLSSLQSQAM